MAGQISRRKQIADRQGVSALLFVNTLIYRGQMRSVWEKSKALFVIDGNQICNIQIIAECSSTFRFSAMQRACFDGSRGLCAVSFSGWVTK